MICSSDRASVIVLTQKAFENRQMFNEFRVVKVYGMAELSQHENNYFIYLWYYISPAGGGV